MTRRLVGIASAPTPLRLCDSGTSLTRYTHDGRKLRLLTVVDEYTRECLTIRVERRMTANDVLWALADLFLEYGIPEHIRSACYQLLVNHASSEPRWPLFVQSS